MTDALIACARAMEDAIAAAAGWDRLVVTAAALHDEDGNVLAQSAGSAAGAGGPECCVKQAIAARAPEGFSVGDVFYIGDVGFVAGRTGHATILAPAFSAARLVGFAAGSRIAVDSSPSCAPPISLRIYAAGCPRWDVVDHVTRHHAHVPALLGALPSLLTGCRIGVRGLETLVRPCSLARPPRRRAGRAGPPSRRHGPWTC